MKKLAIAMCVLAPLIAADPAGFALWSGKQLKGFEKALGAKVDPKTKIATEQLAKFGNHSAMVAHREGSGEAELHETQADLFVVQSGEATLVIGGTVVNPKATALNEVRGSSIQGGDKKKLGAGDMVHIPARTAHQLMVESGKQFTYVIVKIDSN